jgi:hypothetical protein
MAPASLLITTVNSFSVKVIGVDDIKHFSLILTRRKNKLECLLKVSFIGLI